MLLHGGGARAVIATLEGQDHRPVPLHQQSWSPSPFRGGSFSTGFVLPESPRPATARSTDSPRTPEIPHGRNHR